MVWQVNESRSLVQESIGLLKSCEESIILNSSKQFYDDLIDDLDSIWLRLWDFLSFQNIK